MSWESRKGRGRYYTRSRRRDGKVVREYMGTGEAAALAARRDALEHVQREGEAAAQRQREAEADALDAAVAAAFHAIELLATASLLVAGYRQHHRGEWRKSRENRNKLK